MKIVFTDLDGTLLDPNDYSFEAALPALAHLKRTGTPCVFVTSKTRAEVEYWRRALTNSHPFIVENGGAAYIPQGYFPSQVDGLIRDRYIVLERGVPYSRLVEALDNAARESQCPVKGFHQMAVAEIAQACNMPVEMAALAKLREYDEPFEISDPSCALRLLAAIEKEGLHCTHGGRLRHIIGPNDKAQAVLQLTAIFKQAYGEITSIGLGDALNDASFLRVVDIPIVMPSPFASEILKLVPNARLASLPGPQGWNDAVLSAIADTPYK